MEDIIKLIDLSLEDGRLSQDDYSIILKKAESMGISEEEFNLILSKRAKQFESRTGFDIKRSGSKLPYIFAALAVAFTFVDWIGAYSHSSVMGTSASWDTSFSGWWGGYGAAVVMIYAVGCYFYSKGNNLYWLAGLLAIADALYIYSAIANADVSVSYNYEGYGGSSEAGYELLWGFWAFVIASALFALSAPFIGNRSKTKMGIKNRFKQNFKSGWTTLSITAVISIIAYTLIISSDESLNMALIIAILITIILSMITLFIYIFSYSVRSTGYFILGISLISSVAIYLTGGERADFIKILYTIIPYPICYIILERIISSRKTIPTSVGGIGIILLVSALNNSCSDQPKMKFSANSMNNINGTYTSESGGVESSLTVIGDSWFGTNTETGFGNLISSGAGIVEDNKIYDEYGIELGYISNGIAYVNIGGYQLTLYKE